MEINYEYQRLVLLEYQLDGYMKMYSDDIEAKKLKEHSNYLLRGWFPEHGCYSSDTFALKLKSGDADMLAYKQDLIELIDDLEEFLDKKKPCNNSAMSYNRLYSLFKKFKFKKIK